MFGRQQQGAVVCRTCNTLVGVKDATCANCGAAYPALWGYSPVLRKLGTDFGFLPLTIAACVLLYAATLLAQPECIRSGGVLRFLSPSPRSLLEFGAAGWLPVIGAGRWWAVLSAGWLHGGLLHIGFNLYWLTRLSPDVAACYGPGRMVILYTAGTIGGFTLTSLSPYAPNFLRAIMGQGLISIGASAGLFGLLGALAYFTRRAGNKHLSQQVWGMIVLLFVFGLVVDGVDNWGHLGGFLGGFLGGKILNPLKPERINHLAIALVCLVLSALSVIAALVVPLPEFLDAELTQLERRDCN